MTKLEPDDKELQEILELAKEAEQKLREMSRGLTALAERWQQRTEDKTVAATKEQEV